MPKALPEKIFADSLVKMLDTASDPDYHWIVFSMQGAGTVIQTRVYKLIMAFVENWAVRYRTKDIKESQALYSVCKACYLMVTALNDVDLDSPAARLRALSIKAASENV